ncbi:MAG: sensor histidine kinase [Deltaproteobacteria bacterium]|nr:MAG: sensor histidine kinase [Deltaproteobacteria bacterium]
MGRPSRKKERAAPERDGNVVPLHGAAEEPAELSLRILWSLARWVEEVHGREQLERLAHTAGIEAAHLDGRNHWTSLARVETFLEGVRDLAGSDEGFVRACGHRIKESYGPLNYVLWAVTPDQVIANAVRTVRFVSRISRYEVLEHTRGRLRACYYGTRPESRWMCLSRQANAIYLPTIWGMPKAEIREHACIARGDPCCDYEVHVFASARWLPAVFGGLLGAAAGVLAGELALSLSPLVLTTALGATVGYLLELRRVNRLNLRLGAEVQETITRLTEEETQARQELHALRRRQEDWVRLVEEQLNDRSAAFQSALGRLRSAQQARETQIRGYSHDLRNPLAVIVSGIEELLAYEALSEDGREIATEVKKATVAMERLLKELMDAAIREGSVVRMAPERIPTEGLADRLRRRLKALAYGKPLRVSAFATREIPEHLTVDPVVFDRIVDNLLTNAVKYTDTGSIVVELTGTPSTLTLKVSDTGRGIPEARMREIFRPGASTARAPNSYGVGLSVVVQLLAQLGGRLEVMSREGIGTTFWAHFPVEAEDHRLSGTVEETIHRVVKIRSIDVKP